MPYPGIVIQGRRPILAAEVGDTAALSSFYEGAANYKAQPKSIAKVRFGSKIKSTIPFIKNNDL
jgi:hypothetical protein